MKIQEAQESESAACAIAEARDKEAAELRKQLAEVEGTLSVQQNLEVGSATGSWFVCDGRLFE